MPISDAYEAIIMDALCTGVAITPPTNLYLSLWGIRLQKQDLQAVVGASELTGIAYPRQAVTFGAWSKGWSVSTAAVAFPAIAAIAGPVLSVALMDALSVGEIVYYALTTPFYLIPQAGPLGMAVGKIRINIKGNMSGDF